jgi:ATP-dependent Clp protease ATP-binding subunit ClpB
VLFDEIEKANPEVFNVLLQVLDDGRLTDGKGRTVDFRNTVLIMTSNIASDLMMEMAQHETPALRKRVMEALREVFRPEFLNRLDEIVTFKTLGSAEIHRIVDIQMQDLQKRLEDRKIEVTLSPEAKNTIAEQGFDPVYGARPLKRTLQRLVENPLAVEVLTGSLHEGDKIVVEPRDGVLVFRKQAPVPQPA